MNDRELVERILRYDRAAAEALVHEYATLIYTIARRDSNDPDQVEHQFHQFFAWLAANDYRWLRMWDGRCTLRSYLATLALKTAAQRRKDGGGGTDLGKRLLEPLRRSLRAALGTLTETDQRIIQLRRFDGLSLPEIGMRLAMSADATAVTLHRAEKRLRDQVSMSYPALFEDFVR